MNRYNFIESKGESQPPKASPNPKHQPKVVVESGQRWNNVINGSVLDIISRNANGSWTVKETMRGNYRIHDNGQKEMMENFILSFYKLA